MNKLFNLYAQLDISEKALEASEDSIIVSGYANVATKDRHEDIIPSTAWDNNALANYRKNPIILAFHDHRRPIGVATSVEVDTFGLKLVAKISKSVGEVYSLIKEGILKAFSVGFIVKDADWDPVTDIFVIKELELLEVSVVSVPANQDSLFSLAKSFTSETDYLEFKKSFSKVPEQPIEEKDEDLSEAEVSGQEEDLNMDLKELQGMIDAAVSKAAVDAAAAVAAATPAITVEKSGVEKLAEDLEKRLAASSEASLKAVEDLRAEVKEKQAELEALQKSKMTFSEKSAADSVSYAEKEAAVLVAKATGKALESTKAFSNIVTKYGAHIPSATWELEVSTNMQDEIRRALMIAPIFSKNIKMNNPVMRIPVNPEAGYADWVLESGYKANTSSGTAQDHVLKEINLTAYKLATKEFLGTEEEDDSLIALLPIIRDAMVRRTAKAWDKALLRGAGAGTDPIKGVCTSAAAGETMTAAIANAATVADMITLRRKLGTRGLVPSELVYVVSNEVYYDLLDDATFQTMDKVGNKATLLTGQVGAIANVPVVLTGEFEGKAANKFGAAILNQNNFLVGEYKDLRVESDYYVESQQRVLVATKRVGFQQISSVEGNGVAVFKWIA